MQEVQSERAAHSALGCGVPEQVAQVHGAPRRITQSEKMDVPSPQNILIRYISQLNTRKLGALILPSVVHSWNATSQTNLGSTHLTGALAFGFGVNGHLSVK